MKKLEAFKGSIVKNGMVPVCLNRKADNKKVIVNGCDYNLTDYPKNEYTPIGIVVMDPLHTNARYREGDSNKGKYLIMSLKHMDYDDAENGTTETKGLCWGCDYYDFPELHNYDKVSTVNNTEDEEHVSGYTTWSRIPSTYYRNSGDKCATAPKLRYYDSYKAPSPYKMTVDEEGLPVWGVNPLYTEGGKEANNALSDFEGKKNTEIILSKVKDELKHASKIPNSYEKGNYPSATCCSRFRTEGTESGDWWLPSCGELGYCATFYEQNVATLELINKVYRENICATNLNTYNWSSSEYGSNFARYVFLDNGDISRNYKYFIYYVRAVLAVEVITK